MKKETKRNLKGFLGGMAKLVIGVAAGAAAIGAAPFDKGATAKSIGHALTGQAGNIFYSIDNWVKK